MITLNRIRGGSFALNSDQIETVEQTPDTVIAMLNGHKYVVKESVAEVISLIESFRRNCQYKRGE